MTPQSEATLIDSIVNAISGALGPLSPFTKAVVPSASLEATALVNWLVAGSFNAVSITSAASGFVVGLLGYLLPNLAKKPAAK